ncbi:MAG: hypothetical protein HYV04_20170 [Deltaproteobacteria bacterium]|nr:hypothetical protein [Deltaproteobacteria bacterium]
MKTNLKRKNYYLDERKIKRAKTILGARTETQAINAASKRDDFMLLQKIRRFFLIVVH